MSSVLYMPLQLHYLTVHEGCQIGIPGGIATGGATVDAIFGTRLNLVPVTLVLLMLCSQV